MVDNESSKITIPIEYYSVIECSAVELILECNISSLPINPFEIARKKGYVLKGISKIEYETIVGDSDIRDGYSFYNHKESCFWIIYNADNYEQRVRFTLTHEIGHIILGHKEHSKLAEKLADIFAGYVLVPFPLMLTYGTSRVSEIAEAFNVSMQCAEAARDRCGAWKNRETEYKEYEIALLKQFHILNLKKGG